MICIVFCSQVSLEDHIGMVITVGLLVKLSKVVRICRKCLLGISLCFFPELGHLRTGESTPVLGDYGAWLIPVIERVLVGRYDVIEVAVSYDPKLAG